MVDVKSLKPIRRHRHRFFLPLCVLPHCSCHSRAGASVAVLKVAVLQLTVEQVFVNEFNPPCNRQLL